MNYMRGFQFIKDREKWLQNILLGAVCVLIPIIGAIVFVGYLFEVIEELHRDPNHKNYGDFDFNRFTDYLGRGIWPWLASLIFGFVIAIPLLIITIVIMVIGVIIGQNAPWLFWLLFIFATFFVTIGITVLSVIVWGPTLHAGLTKEFQFGPMMAFGKDFFVRMKKEMLMTALVLLGCSLVAAIPEAITCGLAAYFILPVLLFAEHHWMFQMYELYLQRGGTPITTAETVPTVSEAPPP
jgi:hypothetical protein